jgi:SAM-dependent methyltransferase
MEFSRTKITNELLATALLFGGNAKNTIMYENRGKHLAEIGFILENFDGDGRILDVGGGVGVNLVCLSRLLNRKLDFELMDQFIEYGENNRMGSMENAKYILKTHDISIVQQDFIENQRFDFPDKCFDVVTCFDVIEHLPTHPLNLFGEIRRVVKHNGTFIVGVPNAISFHRRIKLLLGQHPYIPFDEWCQAKYYQHYREYTADEMNRLLSMAGFKIIKTILSEEPIATMAKYSYHKNFHRKSSKIGVALYVHYVLSKLLPALRQSVYCVARKAL